ncbi:MAG: FMN-binding negative transcriptional regulator [Frankia sp.]
MLIHPWDEGGTDDGLALAAAHGFGHLIAAGRDRPLPVVVPTQFLVEGQSGRDHGFAPDDHHSDGPAPAATVWLHLARPNPIWAAIEENPMVLLAVAGDWAYIPAAWKTVGAEDQAWGIPTTYYAAVQLIGTAEVIDDDAGRAAILRRQLAALETDVSAVVDPAEHGRRLAGILGLRITVDQVVTKLKYGGNVDAAHRGRIADALADRDGPGDLAARAHLLRRSPDL